MTLSFHPPWLDHPSNIGWSVQIMKLLICSLLQSPTTSSVVCPNIFLSIVSSVPSKPCPE
jgi:hypothetical protein